MEVHGFSKNADVLGIYASFLSALQDGRLLTLDALDENKIHEFINDNSNR